MAQKVKIPSIPKLQLLNEDLENYFSNTIIPQLFIDSNMILRKFTPPAMKQFTLSHADIGKNMKDVIENIRYPMLLANIKEVIDTAVALEKEVQTTDNCWFQMNILPYVVRKNNRTNGVIITFVDITDRLATLKELEKLNADYETYMYAVAHDIKQPLSTIFLLAESLQHAVDNNDYKFLPKAVDILKRSANNMKVLLNDFSANIKVEADIKSSLEKLSFEKIINDVILALRDDVHNKGISITTSFKTDEIRFSRKNLRSIVYNLLINSIKYKKPGKPLKVQIKTQKVKEYVVLTVSDNGSGIDKKYHKTIFKKFVRINNLVEGTGMGLYIVKKMMENNGGKIELQSAPGKGSTFKLFFKNIV